MNIHTSCKWEFTQLSCINATLLPHKCILHIHNCHHYHPKAVKVIGNIMYTLYVLSYVLYIYINVYIRHALPLACIDAACTSFNSQYPIQQLYQVECQMKILNEVMRVGGARVHHGEGNDDKACCYYDNIQNLEGESQSQGGKQYIYICLSFIWYCTVITWWNNLVHTVQVEPYLKWMCPTWKIHERLADYVSWARPPEKMVWLTCSIFCLIEKFQYISWHHMLHTAQHHVVGVYTSCAQER